MQLPGMDGACSKRRRATCSVLEISGLRYQFSGKVIRVRSTTPDPVEESFVAVLSHSIVSLNGADE